MDKFDLEYSKEWLNSLNGEKKQAAIDALNAILGARLAFGGIGGKLPPDIETTIGVDPNLEKPEQPSSGSSDDNVDIDDPDNVLNSTNSSASSNNEKNKNRNNQQNNDNDKEDDTEIMDKLDDTATDEHELPDISTLNKINVNRTLKVCKKSLSHAQNHQADPADLQQLQNLINELENLSDDDLKNTSTALSTLINKALDAADKIDPITYSSDFDARLRQIKKEFGDEKALAKTNKDIQTDDLLGKQAEIQQQKANERAKQKYDGVKSLAAFYLDFKKAIQSQVDDMYDEAEEDSWTELNRRHDNDGIVLPGAKIVDKENLEIPTIDIYVDCSGSWGDDDIKLGEQVVKSVLDFEDRGEIKTNLYYFNDHVFQSQEEARSEWGNTLAWREIIASINLHKTKNVVIITDTDMGTNWSYSHGNATVPGCVWFLWRDGMRAKILTRNLIGKKGTYEYKF